LSWQIIPKILIELLTDPDQQRANRAMQAMLQMSKIDVKKLEEAASAKSAASTS
jgi:predicted 3-demethylubiquinone-9 3-methyltransferase (glyoxalase superfamily)